MGKNYELIQEELNRLAGVWPPLIRSPSVHLLPKDLFSEHPPKSMLIRLEQHDYLSNSPNETDDDVDEDFGKFLLN